MNKIILAVIALAVIAGGAVYFAAKKQKATPANEPSLEKQEDKMMKDKDMMPTPPADSPGGGQEKEGMMKDETMMEKPQTATFNLTGRNFAFSQTEIKVKKGDKVIINFQSTDGFHDWTLEGYNLGTTQVNTGGQTSVEFTADQTGSFEYFCSVGSHRALGMTGKLIVE